MSLNFDEDGDDIIIEGDQCPDCGGEHTIFDRLFETWKCEDCSQVWGSGIDQLQPPAIYEIPPDHPSFKLLEPPIDSNESPDVCPTCQGDRMVPNEFEGYDECPICGGSGYV